MRQHIMQPSKNAESRDESEAEGHAGALKLDVICHRLLDASQSHGFSLHVLGRGASGSRVVAFPMRQDPLALRLRLHATSDECMIPLHEIAFKVGSWRRSQDLENEANMQETAWLAGLAPAPIHCAWLATTAPTPFRGVLAMRRLTGPTLYKWIRLLARDDVRSLEGAGPWLREAQRLRHRIGDLGLVNTDIHDNNLVFDVTDPTIRAAVFREREPSEALQAHLLAAIAQAWALPPKATPRRVRDLCSLTGVSRGRSRNHLQCGSLTAARSHSKHPLPTVRPNASRQCICVRRREL